MLIPAAWSQARRRWPTTCARSTSSTPACSSRGTARPRSRSATAARRGATLDRNGLRPCRYQVTRDGLVVLASEAGVLDLDPAEVVVNDRLRARPDADRRHRRRAHPRRRRDQARAGAPPPLSRAARRAEDLPRGHPLAARRAARAGRARARSAAASATPPRSCATSSRRWRATAQEPIASMGDDTPLAALSRAARGCCAASSSSSSRRSRTPPSTRSARRS